MSNYELTQQTPTSIVTGDIITCAYSGSYKTITLPKGTYKLECWGAQGGSYSSTYTGGKGGYSQGVLTLNAPTLLYLYVGQQNNSYGTSAGASGGTAFNGGGAGKSSYYSSTYTYSCSGGGGTDIRIGSDSLYARVIVAGGGSGSTNRSNGYAGGGTTSKGYNSTYQATATTAGIQGSFGVGADCVPTATNYKYVAAGGGGGWYGGGSSTGRSDSDTSYCQQHGGGSGYVYTSSTASNYPSNCLLNSSYYLISAATTAGDSSFPSPSGGTETGHSGHGSIKITAIEVPGLISKILLKTSSNKWTPLFGNSDNNNTNETVTINMSYTDSQDLGEGDCIKYVYTMIGSTKYLQGTVSIAAGELIYFYVYYAGGYVKVDGSVVYTHTSNDGILVAYIVPHGISTMNVDMQFTPNYTYINVTTQ